jgi:HK97 family phage prohead protease
MNLRTACREFEFGDRLTTLHNGGRGLRGGLACEVREPSGAKSGAEAELDFIASDESLDRYDEVILASGWELENYRRNPVVMDSHDYSSVARILGTSSAVAVVNGRLMNRVKFSLENPLGKMAYGMARGGFIRSESVGFIPLEWENGDGKGPKRTYTRAELIEISLVAVPANPGATIGLALDAGFIERSDLKELADYCARLSRPRFRGYYEDAVAGVRAGVSDLQNAVDRLLRRL